MNLRKTTILVLLLISCLLVCSCRNRSKTGPKDAQGYLKRGLAFAKKGDPNRAITDFDKALKLNPNYAEAYFNRGLVYSHQKEEDRAIADFTEAIKLNAKLAPAFLNRGLVYYRKGI